MYSVMAIFNSSIVGDCSNTPRFHHTPEKKIGRRKIRRSWRPNGFRNDSVRKHVVQECHRHMRCMSRSAILLKVGIVNFILFRSRNDGIHNIVTVPLGVESVREKNGSDYAPTRHSNPNINLLIMQLHLYFCVFFVL